MQFGCYGRNSTGFLNIIYYSGSISLNTIAYSSGGIRGYSSIRKSKHVSKMQGADARNGEERMSKYLIYKGFGKDYSEDANPFGKTV